MATEKNISTRIQNKNDIEANWIKAINFIPKIGEIIIYNAEIEGTETQLPKSSDNTLLRDYWITYPRIKIGNGLDNVNDLPFITDEIWGQVAQAHKFWAEDDNAGAVKFKAITLAPASQGVY